MVAPWAPMVPPDDVSQTQTAAGEGVLRGLGLEPYPAAANTTTGTRGEATWREQGWEMMHDALRCPLSRERFVDPVVAGDGFSYERVHILAWIEEEGGEAATSPITRRPMGASLVPNHALRQTLEAWNAIGGGGERPPTSR